MGKISIMKKHIGKVGGLIIVISIILAWVFFSWKLALVIFLALLGNNLEQKY